MELFFGLLIWLIGLFLVSSAIPFAKKYKNNPAMPRNDYNYMAMLLVVVGGALMFLGVYEVFW